MWLKRILIAVALLVALAAIASAQDSTTAAPPATPVQATTPPPAAPATPDSAAQPAPTTQPAAPAPTAQTAAPAPTAQTPESRIEVVKQSLAASKNALKQYEWMETVSLSVGGEDKGKQQSRCYRDAEGTRQKTAIAPAGAKEEEKKRGLRGRAAEKKKGELDATLKTVTQLVHQYVPLDPVKIQAAKDEGNVSVSLPADDNRVRITIKNYLQPGDEVALTVDVTTNAVKAVSVTTAMAKEKGEKSPVVAKVTYGALPDGTLYPAKEAVEVSAESLKMDIENTGHKKQAS
jgi:hypothetical protein